MRTLIAGGGTGGHLTPALAVAQALRRTDPAAEITLVTRRGGVGLELADGLSLRVVGLSVSGVDTSRPVTVLKAAAQMPAAVLRAASLLGEIRPDVVVGTAGYVCVPVVLAARLRRIPVLLMEQNAVPGRAIRSLARRAAAVAVSFEETSARLPGAHCVVTGNPVRAEFTRDPVTPPPGDRCRNLLVMGGSQGARRLNQALANAVRDLLVSDPELRVVHQCGRLDAEWVLPAAAALPAELRARYQVAAFFEDVAAQVRAADLVVMRAGGSSVAEVAVLGRPMVLVPYPHAGGHQRLNALPYSARGAAVIVADEEFSGARLRQEVQGLTRDPARWRMMAMASAVAGRPDAADRVAELLGEIAGGRSG